eukprot:4227417-Amphidinium_carterae.1
MEQHLMCYDSYVSSCRDPRNRAKIHVNWLDCEYHTTKSSMGTLVCSWKNSHGIAMAMPSFLFDFAA